MCDDAHFFGRCDQYNGGGNLNAETARFESAVVETDFIGGHALDNAAIGADKADFHTAIFLLQHRYRIELAVTVVAFAVKEHPQTGFFADVGHDGLFGLVYLPQCLLARPRGKRHPHFFRQEGIFDVVALPNPGHFIGSVHAQAV